MYQLWIEAEADEESKAFGLQWSLSRRESAREGEMTQFCFTQRWCQRRRILWRLWRTWWAWAGPWSTRETHNVSFVLNDCTVGTRPSLSSRCLLSPVKCGNDFCSWTSVRFFWEGWVLPSAFPSVPISASPSSSPSSDKIQSFGWLCREFAAKEWCFESGWSEVINACERGDRGN